MKFKTIGFITALMTTIIGLSFATCNAAFNDIEGSYTENEITVLEDLGIISGDENENFNPNDNITRAEFAKLVCRMLEVEPPTGGETVFEDVGEGHWAKDYINYCYSEGLIVGTVSNPERPEPFYVVDLDENGNIIAVEESLYIEGMAEANNGAQEDVTLLFEPDRSINLNEAAKILVCSVNYKPLAQTQEYPYGYIKTAADLGIVDGVDTSNADAPITRETAAKLIYNTLYVPMLEEKVNPESGAVEFYIPDDGEGVTLYQKNF